VARSFRAGLKTVGAALLSVFSRLGLRRTAPELSSVQAGDSAELQRECADLRIRLSDSEARLAARSALLYDVQQHYSSEHFELQKQMRDLKTEKMRNAGAYATLETTLERARALQERIRSLKDRLRRYEAVEDEHFDTAPILIEQPRDDEGP